MNDERVQYALRDGVATIRIDDGKRNALSPAVLREISICTLSSRVAGSEAPARKRPSMIIERI